MSRPLTRENNKDYEHIKPTQEILAKKGIKGSINGWHFGTKDKILQGENWVTIDRNYPKRQQWYKDTQIPGLRCPDCDACAHKTDVPGVATCCQPIGWYFFYRRLDQDVSSKAKLVIKNGELVQETGTDKQEGSF